MVFYDYPETILKTLKVIQGYRGDVKISLGREITKLFEEIITDNISNVIEHFKDGIKGEIVCIIYAENSESDFDLKTHIIDLKKKGFRDKDISIILSGNRIPTPLSHTDTLERPLHCRLYWYKDATSNLSCVTLLTVNISL